MLYSTLKTWLYFLCKILRVDIIVEVIRRLNSPERTKSLQLNSSYGVSPANCELQSDILNKQLSLIYKIVTVDEKEI